MVDFLKINLQLTWNTPCNSHLWHRCGCAASSAWRLGPRPSLRRGRCTPSRWTPCWRGCTQGGRRGGCAQWNCHSWRCRNSWRILLKSWISFYSIIMQFIVYRSTYRSLNIIVTQFALMKIIKKTGTENCFNCHKTILNGSRTVHRTRIGPPKNGESANWNPSPFCKQPILVLSLSLSHTHTKKK